MSSLWHWTTGLLLAASLMFLGASSATAADTDGDGIQDNPDNCELAANADQTDSDGDGFGNACDADYDNNGVVGGSDFGRLRAGLGKTSEDPDFDPVLDCDGDGAIGDSDVAFLQSQLGSPPGP